MSTLRLTLWGTPEQVADGVARIDAFCGEAGLAGPVRFRLQVCLAEALNNIVEHGDREGGAGPIGVACRLGTRCLTLRISDAATSLAALPGAELPDLGAESGRGWPILHRWTDGIGYRRRAGVNRLYLTLRRDAA